MNRRDIFNILDRVDSTNNYAMAKVHEGLAKPGEAWFAHEQTAGKGQRGKQWHSAPRSSLLMSIAVQPGPIFSGNPFYISALVALACKCFLERHTQHNFHIKWPNDLYWRDRKTGGILIETKYVGPRWAWAVIGIGINVRQSAIEDSGLSHATSLDEITGDNHLNPEDLGRELHLSILNALQVDAEQAALAITDYNASLYKKNETVRLKKGNVVFATQIREVNSFGQLITEDNMQRVFNHGEVEWLSEV